MNVSRFSIHHPVFTMMITCLVLILGGISLWRIPIDLMPDISLPRISISTTYENASPEEVEELVTRPIEEAVSAIAGVEEVSSDSAEGRSRVIVSLAWGTDVDVAVNDVRDRLDRVIGRLPEDAERPTLRKYNPADFPIFILGISSHLDPAILRNLVDNQIKYRLERVDGVAAVEVQGGDEREIHVDLDIDKLKAMNISVDKVLERIEEGNVDLPAGSIYAGNMDIRIRTPGIYSTLDQLRETLVGVRKGAPVRLRDVGEVTDSWREKNEYILINGKLGMNMVVYKQSGSNTVTVAKGVLDEVEKINLDFPQLSLTPIVNTADYIERSIDNMMRSALYGGLLAVVVLLVFLRDFRCTFVVAISIPISIIATFALMYFNDFTLNIMTIGGLALGIGMLVDNAIVVMENILRLRDEGRGRVAAALEGGSEVTSAIVASTFTTLVVFLPLIFMRGMAGMMFKQLALVVSFSLFCSLAVAILVVPMLSSKLVANHVAAKGARKSVGDRLFNWSEGFFMNLEQSYKGILHWALSHRLSVVLISLCLLGGVFTLCPFIGTELMPEADECEVRIDGEMAVGTRVDLVRDKFFEIHKIVEEAVPEFKCSQAFIGGKPWRPSESNSGELRITLKPVGERKRSDSEIAAVLAKALRHIPGMEVRTRKGQGFFLLSMATRGMERLTVDVCGHDIDTGAALARQVEDLIKDVPGVADIRSSRSAGSPEELIVIDRRKAEEMGVSVYDIAQTLQTALAGSGAGEFREAGDEYRILVKLKNAKNLSLDQVLDITVTNDKDKPIVLKNVVKTKSRSGPVIIERKNQRRVIELRANIRGRDMGSVAKDIRDKLRSLAIPQGFTVGFGGDYEEQKKAFNELLVSFVLAVVLVYMVMAAQFESFRDPFVVMFSVPFAAIGVILILVMTDTTLNLQSFIGCIMLAGIVVNNAILLVDHTNLLRRREGMGLFDAIEEAGRRRLRPILMTVATTTLALVPLAIGLGEGGEAQAPMARAVIGGLLSSTFITLIFVPVVYSLAEWRREFRRETCEIVAETQENER